LNIVQFPGRDYSLRSQGSSGVNGFKRRKRKKEKERNKPKQVNGVANGVKGKKESKGNMPDKKLLKHLHKINGNTNGFLNGSVRKQKTLSVPVNGKFTSRQTKGLKDDFCLDNKSRTERKSSSMARLQLLQQLQSFRTIKKKKEVGRDGTKSGGISR